MNRLTGLVLILTIGLMSVCCSRGGIKDPSMLVKHTDRSTVALVWSKEDGSVRPFCTGTWISGDEILTAHHCVQAIANKIAGTDDLLDVDVIGVKIHYIVRAEVEGIGEEPSGVHLGKVLADDKDHDLAIIRAVGKMIPEHDVARIAGESAAVGEKIYVVGQVVGLYWTHIEGIVAAYREDMPMDELGIKGPFIQVSAPIFYGNSGGGIFNSDGELIGVVSFIMRAPLTGFGIQLDSVKKFVKEAHTPARKL